MDPLDEQLEGVAVLSEPARRALYEFVVSRPEPTSREQAAEALGMPAHSVKFHLDKLAASGLLEVGYRRLTGRSGPGAGRPSKLYRRSDREVAVSVPPRRYDLVGQVLAGAVDRAVRDGVPVAEAVPSVARETGRGLAADLGAEVAGPAGRPAARSALDRTKAVLGHHGYAPRMVGEDLCLANCPFHRLAADHTALVCGINLALVEGVLEGLEAGTLHARLEPQPGLCCVKVGR